jgi:hypothetical protein
VTLAEAIASQPAVAVPKLTDAMACADCECIFVRTPACPYCGSASLLNLAEVLNRGNSSTGGEDPEEKEIEC